MSEIPPVTAPQKPAAWAPYDYTDGKSKGDWKTAYPDEARKWIRRETAYLVVLLFGCISGVFYIVRHSCEIIGSAPLPVDAPQSIERGSLMFYGFVGALLAGTVGGCSFGLKCMYHFVAKRMWHEDRRLWRLLSPPLSGILSLFMVFLVASGLLQVFDGNFVEQPIRVMAFSFLVGYFSDKALAKMADVADTLFGGANKEDKVSREESQR